ncbi:hypothetical protein O181_092869 [Austropuccinia psidii MF-1]|uniref:Uncharacterized protein n=1 Tax=Austropuccinia psidii MF-1 TaxID=1389203 RepID=A0A9Q3J046_9BASI|nr:hypothetical protein [Austropuccinia psidii MF-1]
MSSLITCSGLFMQPNPSYELDHFNLDHLIQTFIALQHHKPMGQPSKGKLKLSRSSYLSKANLFQRQLNPIQILSFSLSYPIPFSKPSDFISPLSRPGFGILSHLKNRRMTQHICHHHIKCYMPIKHQQPHLHTQGEERMAS